jgi:hypothetical protein
VALLFNAGGSDFRFFKAFKSILAMSRRRNCSFNDDLQKELKFIKLDKLDNANSVIFIFPYLMEAEATSTNIYVARNIRMLKRLWLQLKTSARLK